jgi:CP family cyanate transporter-like MFS transporter
MIKRRWPGRGGLLIGIYLTGLSVGAVLAALFSVPLYNASGGSVRLILGLWALPAMAATLVWISQARYGSAARRAPAPTAALAAPGEAHAAPTARAGPSGAPARVAVHRHVLAWQVTAFMGLQSLVYYAAVSWLPEMFRDRGASAGTAGTLAAVMAFGGLITSLSTPMLAQRIADQRVLVAPAVIVTAIGLVGALYAPLGSEIIWMLVLGAAQGAALGLAIFFTMARAPDPGTAASLSSLAQAVGYLVAAAGPLAVGFLHTATKGWTVPIMVLLVLCVAEIIAGLLAGRAKILPVAGVAGDPDAVGAQPAEKS